MAVEDFTTYEEVDTEDDRIQFVGTNHIDFDAYENEKTYLYKDFGVDYFGDFEHRIDIKGVYESAGFPTGSFWLLANSVDAYYDLILDSQNFIKLGQGYEVPPATLLILSEWHNVSGGQNDTFTGVLGTWYYLTIKKVGASLTCKIYSDSDRTNLLDTLSLTLQEDYKFRYIYPACTPHFDPSYYMNTQMEIENLDLQKPIEWLAGVVTGVASVTANLTKGYFEYLAGVVNGVASVVGYLGIAGIKFLAGLIKCGWGNIFLTEEQTLADSLMVLYSGFIVRSGQRLTISDRKVAKLAFVMKKVGNPTGDITFTIRKVSDDAIIVSEVWGDASDLLTSTEWEEVTFATPTIINEEVRISHEYAGGDGSNYIVSTFQAADVKADEREARYYASTESWYDDSNKDCCYRYTYIQEVSGNLKVIHKLVGVISGVASVLGKLRGSVHLAGVIAGRANWWEEDFTTYTEVDPNSHILVGTNHVDFDAWQNEDAYVYKDKGIDHFGDFRHKIDVRIVAAADMGGTGALWLLSNDIDDFNGLCEASKSFLYLLANHNLGAAHSQLVLTECNNGVRYYSDFYDIDYSTWYYLIIKKVGTDFTCEIYSNSARTNLLATLTRPLHANLRYRYVFVANTYNASVAGIYIFTDIENLRLKEAGGLSIIYKLAGVIAGITTVTGNLLVEYLQFIAGIVSGVASVTGATSILKKLAGTAAGVAAVTGATKVLHKLAGVSAGVTSVTGVLVEIGRVLMVKVVTAQYRTIKPITVLYRTVKTIVTQYRKVRPITTLYRKIKAITGG